MLLVPISVQVSHQIFHEPCNGFRKRRPCVIQLLVLLDNKYRFIENKCQTDVIFTEYGKTFEEVGHRILLSKIFKLGIRGQLCKTRF